MKSTHRCIAVAAACCAIVGAPALAQSFPAKPIDLIVHTGPGGGSDIFTRVVADIIAKDKLLPVTTAVLNKAGGGGAIAQNYVENPAYYPPEMIANAEMMKRMLGVIPAKRLGKGEESAWLAAVLASDRSDFIVAQVIPCAGGWVTSTG